MCLTLKFNTRFCVSYDIKVYKMLNAWDRRKIITPYQHTPVDFKDGKFELWIDDKELKPNFWNDVYRGIHSYQDLTESSNISRLLCYKLYYAVIPAGTPFYVGIDGDVVSSKLIIFETYVDFCKYEEENGKISPLKAKPSGAKYDIEFGYVKEGEIVKED